MGGCLLFRLSTRTHTQTTPSLFLPAPHPHPTHACMHACMSLSLLCRDTHTTHTHTLNYLRAGAELPGARGADDALAHDDLAEAQVQVAAGLLFLIVIGMWWSVGR